MEEEITITQTIIRKIKVKSVVVSINEPNEDSPLVQPPQQREQPPPPKKNNRCLSAIGLFVVYLVGIGSIIIGTVHANDCPAEKILPVTLVVFGAMLLVARLLNCVYDYRSICEEEGTEDCLLAMFEGPVGWTILNIVFCQAQFWTFIAVCVYTFGLNPSTNPKDQALDNYCNYGLYNISFYGCIIGLIIYGVPILYGCCADSWCCKDK